MTAGSVGNAECVTRAPGHTAWTWSWTVPASCAAVAGGVTVSSSAVHTDSHGSASPTRARVSSVISALPGASWRHAAGQASGATTVAVAARDVPASGAPRVTIAAGLGRPVVPRDPQAGHHPAGRVADDVHRRRPCRQRRVDRGVEHRDLRGEVTGAVTDERQHRRRAPGGLDPVGELEQRCAAPAVAGHEQHRAGPVLSRPRDRVDGRGGGPQQPRAHDPRADEQHQHQRGDEQSPARLAAASRPGARASDGAGSGGAGEEGVHDAVGEQATPGGQDGPARGQRGRVEQAVRRPRDAAARPSSSSRSSGNPDARRRRNITRSVARSASVSSSRPASGDSPAASRAA